MWKTGTKYPHFPVWHIYGITGFPSPFLDWTYSPYVAAYFAFRKKSEKSDAEVAVFAYSEMPYGGKHTSNAPSIYSLNPEATTHRRHFLQQSKYTICMKIDRVLCPSAEPETTVEFASHEMVFSQGEPSKMSFINM